MSRQVSLSSAEGRTRTMALCEAVRGALRAERSQPQARRRLAAVRERLRRLHKAKDQVRCFTVGSLRRIPRE